jgi:hypothetical protein
MAHPLQDFAHEVSEHDWPTVVCPTCKAGTLAFSTPTTCEDPASASRHDQEGWDPDRVFGTFHGSVHCTNPACGQWVTITGAFRLVENNGDPKYGEYGELLQVRTFDPPLSLLEVPTGVPTEVADAIAAAATIIWLDPSSAANRMRTAVERVLDHQKVRKTRLTTKNTRQRLTAHARILEFKPKNPDATAAMMAVKWLGNDGTHYSGLTVSDVLEGATVLAVALKAIYDKPDAATIKLIKAINKAKGLPKKSKSP